YWQLIRVAVCISANRVWLVTFPVGIQVGRAQCNPRRHGCDVRCTGNIEISVADGADIGCDPVRFDAQTGPIEEAVVRSAACAGRFESIDDIARPDRNLHSVADEFPAIGRIRGSDGGSIYQATSSIQELKRDLANVAWRFVGR